MIKVFFDTEFTGLHKNTTLVSIGLIAETGERFYAEFTDYDKEQVDEWIKENVISKLWLTGKENTPYSNKAVFVTGDTATIKEQLLNWFEQFEKVEMWSDCLAFDWVLFCDLFGGASKVPSNIFYIPFDICTLFKQKGIDPDISREEFGLTNTAAAYGIKSRHNSMYDAAVIKACYEKLQQ